MAYKNPVPYAYDDCKSLKAHITFNFEKPVNKAEAAEAINKLLFEKHDGKIPPEWVRLENPSIFWDEKNR